jgi:ATP-binding cassette, subfamily B, bacterial
LALLATATLPLFWFSTVRISRRIHEAARKQRRREGAMAATAAESISAIKIVQALSLESVFAEDFSSRNKKSQKEDFQATRLAARLGRTVDVLLALATAMVLWYGARLVLRSEMTPGDLLVFVTYLKRAFHPARDFAKYTARLSKAAAAGERVIELLQQTPDVRDRADAVRAPAFSGAVRFADVSFGYEPGREVLKHVHLHVAPGQYVALAGPSGIGKSTLASLVLRLYDPTEGAVMIDGRDIREYTLASLRGQISVVLQDSILFAATVAENIAYGAPQATREDVEAAARLANAHEFIEALPEGYETVVGERGVTFSHGQRQRIAIARAAVRRCPILILDEPTTGLDEENERSVSEALERLAHGRTTFLITHDLQSAARADLILYLEGGRILESGSHRELIEAGGRYAALYRLQSSTPSDEKNARVLVP